MPEPTPSTIFQPLSGDASPYEQQGPADITGVVLKDLSEKSDLSIAGGQQLSTARIEGQAAPAPAPEQERVAVEDLGPQPGARRPRSAQERIAQLTRRYHEKADETMELRAQVAELRNLIASIPQQLATRAAPQAAPVPAVAVNNPADPLATLLNGGAGPAPTAQPVISPVSPSPLDVSRAVNEALDAREQRQRALLIQSENLRHAQARSFAEACAEFPALGDKRTQAWQTFERLFQASPLRELPDGPFQVALQVKGVLADVAPAQPGPAVRQQASINTPVAAPPVDLTGAQRSTIEKELAKAYDEMRAGGTDFALHKKITVLKSMLRQNNQGQ